MAESTDAVPEFLVDRVIPVERCLLWAGIRNESGIGQIRIDGKNRSARRWTWCQVYGDIPSQIPLRTTCGRPSCVAPQHLRRRRGR